MLDFKLAVLLLSVVDACPITSEHSVNATVGDDVVLPVHLKTKLDTSHLMVLWKLGDLVVHECHDGYDRFTDQNENFTNRTSLFKDKMAEGNVSLRLENVTEEDSGTYNCTVLITDEEDKVYNVSLCVELKASTDERKDGTKSPPPTSPPHTSPPSPPWDLIAGVIGGGCFVGLIGVILGVFLYKRRSRNTEQPGADQEEETPFQ